MDTRNIELKWEGLSNLQGDRAIRITSDCIPDLFIALDENGYRCLLLFLPYDIEIKIRDADKEKLTLTFLKKKNLIIIRLNDNDFIDLFNDLILSLYSKVKKIVDSKSCAKELINAFHKWAAFFEDKSDSRLSNEDIIGLFGELFALNNYLEQDNNSDVNSILDSWKGPYDTTNDFIFDDKNIEVKTKKDSQLFVKISSEFQLEQEFDKGLELMVVSLKIDLTNGQSIYDLLEKIVKLVRENSGDLSILYHAISQKGLTIDGAKDYNNHRFVVVKTNLYDCSLEDFPKLSVSNIPQELTQLRYRLRITALGGFLLEEKIY
ncbi:MAG: hypothetical protein ACI95T_001179 [Flavobacteriales bacterium]|jgi:hypothetical protein